MFSLLCLFLKKVKKTHKFKDDYIIETKGIIFLKAQHNFSTYIYLKPDKKRDFDDTK